MSGERRNTALERGLAALDDIRTGDRIFISSGCAEPFAVVEELVRRARTGTLPSTDLYMMIGGSSGRILAAADERHRIVSLTAGPLSTADYMPWTIHQTANLMAGGALAFDVAVVQTSRPNADGLVSLGLSVDFAGDAVAQARLAVAEINVRMPFVCGENQLPLSRFDGILEVDRPLLEQPPADSTAVSRAVAANVVRELPDGATLEVGVGRVMSDVLRALDRHTDLGLHTGLFIDGMMDLIEAGVITNVRKTADGGVSIANQARGTARMYNFLDQNPLVRLMPARYTHDPVVLAALPDFHAVNSALQVDLMGRVNAELLEGRRVSSTGGLGDFVRAATIRSDAHSIIALAATAGAGNSRIVSALEAPAAVTLTADLADVVVTEFGAAHLRGKLPRERAEALIEIAEPRHADELQASLQDSRQHVKERM